MSHRSETTWISHFELRNFSFHWNSRSWCWRICWLKSIGCRSLPLFHCFVNSNVIPIFPLYCFFLFFQFLPQCFNIWIYALRSPVTSGWGDLKQRYFIQTAWIVNGMVCPRLPLWGLNNGLFLGRIILSVASSAYNRFRLFFFFLERKRVTSHFSNV